MKSLPIFRICQSLVLAGLSLLAGCSQESSQEQKSSRFNPVDTSFHTKELIVPGGKFKYRILFHEGDEVLAEWADTLGMAKGSHDFLAFLPLGKAEDHGILWVNHEAHSPHDVLGDGGGATVMEVFRDSTGDWRIIGMPQAVDFREVGGTLSNCLGAVTPWGTVLTSEETEPLSMRQLCESPGNCAIRDSAGVGGWARWKNYGWMVEVDPLGRKAIRKHHSMGRFMHEGAYCMPDQRTVFLMDDIGPGAFFKFVADRPKDLSQGVLYAFKQGPNGQGGSWIQLPRERDSLLIARELAFKKGATAFIRMEDIELHPDGSFFITETGLDSVDFNQALVWGAQPAKHLAGKHVGNGIYDDKFGRILKFDPSSNQISVYLEGGPGRDDQSIHLSNPDNIALDTKRNQLVIHEDLVGRNAGRLPSNSQSVLINEIYFLDLGIQKPTLDDLQRFAVIPAGAESTGGIWSPDFSAYFFNLQHPSETNPAPFNKACTVVVTGW